MRKPKHQLIKTCQFVTARVAKQLIRVELYILGYKGHQPSYTGDYPSPYPTVGNRGATTEVLCVSVAILYENYNESYTASLAEQSTSWVIDNTNRCDIARLNNVRIQTWCTLIYLSWIRQSADTNEKAL